MLGGAGVGCFCRDQNCLGLSTCAGVGPGKGGRGEWRCRVAVTESPALSPSLSASEGFVVC